MKSNIAEERDSILKKHLLDEAAKKEPRKFYQIDGFANSTRDCVFLPDKDGIEEA